MVTTHDVTVTNYVERFHPPGDYATVRFKARCICGWYSMGIKTRGAAQMAGLEHLLACPTDSHPPAPQEQGET